MGNLHTPILAHGTDEQITGDVREDIRGLSRSGGYVLGSTTSIFDGIPPERFATMVKPVHRYGKYPRWNMCLNLLCEQESSRPVCGKIIDPNFSVGSSLLF